MGSKLIIQDFIEDTKKLDVSELTPFQGQLKRLSEENYNKLRKSLIEQGFRFSLHAWHHAGINYIIDGHQRVHVLQNLAKQAYEIPKLTVNFVKADSYEEAKKLVLYAISQYGEIDKAGFADFTLDLDFDIQDFDLGDFAKPIDIQLDLDDAEEQQDKPQKKAKQCPNCGHRL